MTIQNRLSYVDIAKGIGIILVVLGHSFPDATTDGGIQIPFYKALESLIYSFHMPLFFYLSGYLSPKLILNKENVKWQNKLKQLLIPYLTMSLVYIPLRVFASGMANSSYDIHSFWKILIGISPNGGVWFLYVLSASILFTYFFISKRNLSIWLIIFGFLSILSRGDIFIPSYSVLKYFLYNYFFYILGILIRYRKTIIIKLNLEIQNIVLLSFFLILFYMYYTLNITILAFVLAVLGVQISMMVSQIIDFRKGVIKELLIALGKKSMYIYLFHGPIMVLIRYIVWNKMYLDYNLCVIILFFGGMILSVFTSNLITRSKILNFLITGR